MFTVTDVAKRLNLSSSKVYQLVSEGLLSHHRFGGSIRFSEEQIQDYLEKTKRERGNAPAKSQPPRPRLKHIKI